MLSIGKESQYNILIDGGLSKTYQKHIKSEIQHINDIGQKIGLIVCTHMDNDHICGLIQCLKEVNSDFIENIWYNGLLEQMADLKRHRFGRSTERHETEGQISFMEVDGTVVFFNEAEAVMAQAEDTEDTPDRKRPRKRIGKREEDLSGLPVS